MNERFIFCSSGAKNVISLLNGKAYCFQTIFEIVYWFSSKHLFLNRENSLPFTIFNALFSLRLFIIVPIENVLIVVCCRSVTRTMKLSVSHVQKALFRMICTWNVWLFRKSSCVQIVAGPSVPWPFPPRASSLRSSSPEFSWGTSKHFFIQASTFMLTISLSLIIKNNDMFK